MITVAWTLADGEQGEKTLTGDDKWVFGRRTEAGGDEVDVSVGDDDFHRGVSRTAVVIRDAGPGPVVFRGQRANGARVGVVSADGIATWIDEGTATALTAEAHRVVFHLGDEPLITIDVSFDERPSVVERQQLADPR